MTVPAHPGLQVSERMWLAITGTLSVAVILFTIWCLTQGITIIFMHLYYFPIVLMAYHYRWKGAFGTMALSGIYVALVFMFNAGDTDVILAALFRAGVFLGIALVIAYLAEQIARAQEAKEALREEKDQYLSLAPAIVLVLDKAGVITFINDKGSRILECSREDALSKSWADTFIPAPERESVRSLFASTISGDFILGETVRGNVITAAGRIRHIRWNNTVLRDPAGNITSVLSYGEDITEEAAAAASLKRLQEFQENVIANANVWISVLAPDGTILVWNDAAEQISGYKKADVVGRRDVWKQLYPAREYRKNVTREINRIISRDTYLENFDTEIHCADGTLKTLVWNTRALRDDTGTVTSYIAIGRDVSAQKSAEVRAAESSRFLASMIDTLPMPVFFKDTGGKYLGCNPPFEEYIGIKREDLAGKTVYDISPKDLADQYAAADQQLFDNPVPQRYETQVRYADGSRHDVIFYKAPFFNKDGTLGGLIGSFLDITERKRMEDALQESELFNRSLVENLPEYLCVYGEDGRILYVNPASARALGYDAEAVAGTSIITYVAAEYRDLARSKLASRLAGDDASYEIELISKSGPRRSVTVKAAPIQYRNHPAVLLLLIDITERKRVELALRESEAKYRTLFENMLEGFAYCRLIYDEQGAPADWVYLSVNRAFERLTGLKDVEGKRVREVIPDILNLAPEIFTMYGRVASTGASETFEIDFKPLKSWLKVSAFCPEKGYFVAVFEDVTERKESQDRIQHLLRVQEEQLRIINTSPAVAFLWKAEENWPVVTVSENISQFGYTQDDFLSGRVLFSSIIHPDDLGRVGSEVEYNSSHAIDDYIQEYRIFGKNHDLFWVEDYTHIRRDATGKITHYEGIVLDVTRRKLAEELRKATEYRLDTAMEIGKLAWWEMDMPSGAVRFDERKATMLGYSPEKFRHYRDFTALLHPDDLEPTMQAMRDHLEGIAVRYQGDYRIQASSGEYLWFRDVGGITRRHADGSPATLTGVVIDITASKQADLALKETNDYLTSLFDYANAPIIVWDPEFRITRFNHAFERLTGRSEKDVLGEHLSILFPEESQLAAMDQIQITLAGIRWESVEIPVFHISGEVRTVLWNSATLYADDGKTVISTIAQGQDITDRKRIEAAFLESRQLFMDIISFLPDPTFVIEKDGRVIAWNRALEDISGVKGMDIIGKGDYEYSIWMYGKRRPILIDLVLNPDKDAARMNYSDIRWEGRSVTAQAVVKPPGSEKAIPLSLVATPLLDHEGRITGAIES
ncbi:MAG: PAS domain S-box protein, partial [Methanomicrobiales archaeon]|nr:PAS domain S-box protein [Methanomicrobiales archaeon]